MTHRTMSERSTSELRPAPRPLTFNLYFSVLSCGCWHEDGDYRRTDGQQVGPRPAKSADFGNRRRQYLPPENKTQRGIQTRAHESCTQYRYVLDSLPWYFSFQPVFHDWCNKGCGMCYPVCGMVHIKEPLLLIDKSSLCGSSGFPFSLSEWSLTICLTPYNRR